MSPVTKFPARRQLIVANPGRLQNTSNVENIARDLVDNYIRQCRKYQFACS